MTALLLMTAFIVKHFICDFPLQRWPYMFTNKGTYGHPGGILHAMVHGVATFIVLAPVLGYGAIGLALLESSAHYHIDWAKMNICSKWNLKPDNEWFWHWLGFDQMLHYLTYVAIVWFIISGLA